jgi:hypothetical protein
VIREHENRNVIFDVTRGVPLPPDTAFYRPSKTNFLPKVAIAWAPNWTDTTIAKNPLVISGSFGISAGAVAFATLTRPIDSDRFEVTQTGGVFPTTQSVLEGLFFNNPQNRQYAPLAFDAGFRNTDKVYKYDVSVKRRIYGDNNKETFVQFTYTGNVGRDLLLRTTGNRIISVATAVNPAQPAVVTREFDIPQAGTPLRPFGDLDVRTSKGWSRYDSFQTVLKGYLTKKIELTFDAVYTLGRLVTNVNDTSTTGNPFDLDYDRGLGPEDVRHKFGATATYPLPIGKGQRFFKNADGLEQWLLGNWTLKGGFDWQGGRPIDIKLTRPSVVYVDGAGQIFNSPAAGRTARINVPGGAAGNQRPDLIPGVDPFLSSGDRTYLNPAAFAIPVPGTLGNLRRGILRGPDFKFVDLGITKTLAKGETKDFLIFRCTITNLFNRANFDRPAATLPDALGVGANLLQPGQAFNATIAPAFGIMKSALKRGDADFGASRQIQFGFVLNL